MHTVQGQDMKAIHPYRYDHRTVSILQSSVRSRCQQELNVQFLENSITEYDMTFKYEDSGMLAAVDVKSGVAVV